jgi:hypothetical protein
MGRRPERSSVMGRSRPAMGRGGGPKVLAGLRNAGTGLGPGKLSGSLFCSSGLPSGYRRQGLKNPIFMGSVEAQYSSVFESQGFTQYLWEFLRFGVDSHSLRQHLNTIIFTIFPLRQIRR